MFELRARRVHVYMHVHVLAVLDALTGYTHIVHYANYFMHCIGIEAA